MAKYLKDGVLLSIDQVRRLHPDSSIPDGADLSSLGYTLFKLTSAPAPLPWHRVVESEPDSAEQRWTQVRLTNDEIKNVLLAAVRTHIENIATGRGWTSPESCTARAGYPGPWQDEAILFANWMDDCYVKLFELFNEFEGDSEKLPVSVDAYISNLPTISWP
jgi:hypothetical protein